MKNTKEIGNLTELRCITGLYEIGCNISLPFGNSQKYDLLIEWKGKIYKVQIKHAKAHKNAYFTFSTRWTGHNNTGYKSHTYTDKDIDFFATWYRGKVYLIPIQECKNIALKVLRIVPTKNKQEKNVCYADRYEAKKILNSLC